ncbi:TonB-dependent receptor plug domain-containing protein [Anthocerotibacter panamensis]|uniref:TonB-dependent receptor plug domain-containing protein n=1 Tax=Anthocerotibacter panamensis TaxID=2857077 RepID=UPI001C401A99|nr:TonB-dependent receptor [Anthocerotibacter panamensis]
MRKFSQKKRRGETRFAWGGRVFCLMVFAVVGMSATKAQEAGGIAQARSLDPAPYQAHDLLPVASPVLAQAAPPVNDSDEPEEPVDLLGEFNVTAQRRRTTERENTQTTYVVGKAEIKALGARTLIDALRLVPGFSLVEGLGGIDNRGQNFLRGFDDARFILLQDGRPLTRSSNNRASDINRLPVVNVERVEVVTGGSTLRYGADAIGGVINVITRIPSGPPTLTLGVEAGSFGHSTYTVSYQGSTGDLAVPGNFAFELTYQHQSVRNEYPFTYNPDKGAGTVLSSQFFNPDGTRRINPTTGQIYTQPEILASAQDVAFTSTAYGLYAFSDFYAGKLIFKPGRDHTVTIYVQQQNLRRSDDIRSPFQVIQAQNTTGGEVSANPNDYYVRFNDNIADRLGVGEPTEDETGINIAWDWTLSPVSTLSTQLSFKHTNNFNPGSSAQTLINNRTFEAQLRYIAELYPGNTLNAGFQYLGNRSVQSPQAGFPVNTIFDQFGVQGFDREISRYALYLTEDLQFWDGALVVNGGTRFTSDTQFGNIFTSGAGLRYNFGGERGREVFGLRANYQESFKAPGLTQLYAFLGGPGFLAAPNPYFTPSGPVIGDGLQPERATTYELGLDVQLSPSALLRATYYRTDLSNAVEQGVFIGALDTTTSPARVCQRVPISDPGSDCYSSAFLNASYLYLYQSRNTAESLSTGWDFSFDWKLSPEWRITVTHSIFDTRPLGGVNSNLGSGATFFGFQREGQPFGLSSFLLQYTTPQFNAALSGSIVGDRPDADTRTKQILRKGYTVVDLTTSFPLSPSITFNGGIYNLFNNFYESRAGRPSPGINFRAGLTTTF